MFFAGGCTNMQGGTRNTAIPWPPFVRVYQYVVLNKSRPFKRQLEPAAVVSTGAEVEYMLL